MNMSLTTSDLAAIKQIVKQIVDDSIETRVPPIVERVVKPMFDELETRISAAFDDTQASIDDMRGDIDEIKEDLKTVKVSVRRLELRGTLKA